MCGKYVLFTQIGENFSIKFLKQGDALLLLCAQNLKMQLRSLEYTFFYPPRQKHNRSIFRTETKRLNAMAELTHFVVGKLKSESEQKILVSRAASL